MADDASFPDIDDIIGLYIDEAAEHITLLASSLLAIEQGSEYDGAIREAFRAAHSLKGMSATIGFSSTAAVTHELEALLDRLRNGEAQPERELVSCMLTAADALGMLLQNVEQSGTESLDVSHVIETLQRFTSQLPVYNIELEVSPDAAMPAVRAFQAVVRLEGLGTLIESDPPRSAIDDGTFQGGVVRIVLQSRSALSDIESAALGTGVLSVVVTASQLWQSDTSTSGGDVPITMSDEPRSVRTVRVAASRLDKLMHGVEDLMVRRARLQSLVAEHHGTDIALAIAEMDRAARTLQDLVMDVRMVRIETVFRLIPRLVRDLSNELGKTIDLTITGQDTEIDRTVVEVISDPLIHLIRNAIDHGIELPHVRAAAGKSSEGRLTVSARSEGTAVLIEVRDDGRGFDVERIRTQSIDRGLVDVNVVDTMTRDEIIDLCFLPGFSTRDEVNRISGRGVGLDVVRSGVRSMGGDVSIETHASGSSMIIRLPLTLAIRSVLAVRAGVEVYCIHADRVGKTIDVSDMDLHSIAGQTTCLHMGQVVPLVNLADILGSSEASEEITHVVLVESAKGRIALGVSGILGQLEVVTRSLSGAVQASRLITASAVLGNGDIAFLLDTDAIDVTSLQPGQVHAIQ